MKFLPVEDIEMPSDDTEVWRYINLQKYIHMITHESLWFPLIDKFDDPWEGEQTIQDDEDFRQFSRKYDINPDITEVSLKFNSEKILFSASCWHASTYESAALWKLFEPYGSVVAIKSTIGRLSDSLESPDNTIFCGKIKYINYDVNKIGIGKSFQRVFHKRISFGFEREIRLARINIANPAAMPEKSISDQIDDIKITGGSSVKVNLQSLICEVIVSPTAESWVFDSILAISKAFKIDESIVRHSKLYTPK